MSDISKMIPTKNIMKDEFGWEIPIENVPVPSEGKVYPQGTALHNRKFLKIKAMTAREEDILASRALIQEGTVITHLLQSCLVEDGVDVQDLLLGDRNALMVSVRITGYGADYRSESQCPECNTKSAQSFNLSEMEISPLKIDPVSPGQNVFSYTLPITKKEVHFKFLTGAEDRERSVAQERKKKLMPEIKVDNEITSRLETQIISIDGITDKNKIVHFIRHMPALDSRNLRSYIMDHEPGIDMSVWMKCPHCSESSRVSLPVGSNFFWPAR